MSSEDKRFSEFLKCFSILFAVSAEQLMDDYNYILKMVEKDVFKTKEFNWISFNRNR